MPGDLLHRWTLAHVDPAYEPVDTDHDHLAKLSIIHFASLRSLCNDKCVTPCGVILPATDLQGQNAKVASVGTVILQIR